MQPDMVHSHTVLTIDAEHQASRKDRLRIARFQEWLTQRTQTYVDRFVLLEFAAEIGTRGVLVDLEKTLLLRLPEEKTLQAELRAAVRDHRRRVDGKKVVVEMLAAPWWAPFLPHSNMDDLYIHEIRRLDDWLSWLHDHRIRAPKASDYIEFAKRWDSEVPLQPLQRAFAKLPIPNVPAIEVELNLAIAAIRAKRNGAGQKVRKTWPLELSVAKDNLPTEWKDVLRQLAQGTSPVGRRCPSAKFLPTIEGALRTLCFCWRNDQGVPDIDQDAAVSLVRELKRRGTRASTQHIAVSALRRFMVHLGAGDADVQAVRRIEQEQNLERRREVPRKFARLTEIGSTQTVLGKAADLLAAARSETSLELRTAKLNGAAALALFSLVPLRVADTNLLWGKHVTFTGVHYRLDLVTSKTGEEFHGELCDFVTPFLDALLLRGCDECFLEQERSEAIRKKRHLFAHANGRHMSDNRVGNLWARHLGCRPHLARSLVHTELGKTGAAGVEMALSLCAQRDAKTAEFYQGKAMRDALVLQGNELLLSGIPQDEIEKYFPALDKG